MEINFTAKISKKDIDIEIPNMKDQFPSVESDITLKWEARIVFDNQKISDIVASVPDQEVTVTIEFEKPKGEDDFEYDQKEITLKISDVEIEYDRGDVSDSRALGLMPTEITCYKGKWTVKFCSHSV